MDILLLREILCVVLYYRISNYDNCSPFFSQYNYTFLNGILQFVVGEKSNLVSGEKGFPNKIFWI